MIGNAEFFGGLLTAVVALGGLMLGVVNRLDKRIDMLATSLVARIDGHDARFDRLDAKVDGVAERLGTVELRLTKRIDEVDLHLGERISDVRTALEVHAARPADVAHAARPAS